MDQSMAKNVKAAIWKKGKVLDFDEILYFGYLLIKNYKHVRYLIQCQFPFVFIDEYQDTNPIQNAIVKTFADNFNNTLGVIGDLAQSIFSFNASTYQEFKEFSTESKEKIDYVISGNRRSSANIIHFLNYIRKADDKLNKQSCEKNIQQTSKVAIMLKATPDSNIMNLIPEDCAILCRSDASKFQYIRNVEADQKAILKKISGTYKYQFGNELHNELENNRSEWIRLCNFVVSMKNAISRNNLASAIRSCKGLLDIDRIIIPSQEQGELLKQFHKFISKIKLLAETAYFEEIETNINSWLQETGFVLNTFSIPETDQDPGYSKALYDNINKLQYKTIELMVNELFTEKSKTMTIHKAKGLEFENVLVDIEPFKKEKDSGISELGCILDPKVFSDSDSAEKTEYARLVYVGLSRAINKLYLVVNVTDVDSAETQIRSALNAYMTAQNIIEPFFEIIKV